MKQQRSASSLRPSKLSRFLLAVLVLKLSVLGTMLFEYALPELSALSLVKTVAASAAEPDAVAAPGSAPITAPVPSEAPEAGIIRPDSSPSPVAPTTTALPPLTPAANASSPGAPSAPTANTPQQGNAGQTAAPSTNGTNEAQTNRQEELARKEQELRALETDISAKLEQMQTLESRLQIMMKEADETVDAKFRHTVDVLSNMKAKQAAAVLATLDERIAVKVLAGMRGRQAGEILTFVDPQKAARLTEALVRIQMPMQ